MRNTNEIIADLKHNVEWSQPNVKYNDLMNLIEELEQVLNTDFIPEPLIPFEASINEEPPVKTMATGYVKVEEKETPTIDEIPAIEEISVIEEVITPRKGRKPSTNI